MKKLVALRLILALAIVMGFGYAVLHWSLSRTLAQSSVPALSGPLSADCFFTFQAQGVAASPAYDNRVLGCTSWVVVGYNNGAGSGTTRYEFDGAQDSQGVPGAFSALTSVEGSSTNIALANAVSITQAYVVAQAYQPWVRVNVTTCPTCGLNAWDYFSVFGYRQRMAFGPGGVVGGIAVQGGPAAGTSISGIAPVYIGGTDGTNGQFLSVDTSGRLRLGATASIGDGAAANPVFPAASASTQGEFTMFPYLLEGATPTASPTPGCDQNATLAMSSATTTQIVALSGTRKIRVCKLTVDVQTLTAGSFQLVQGTGAACVTAQTALFPTNAVYTGGTTLARVMSFDFPGVGQRALAGNALCVTQSAAATTQYTVVFSQW